MAESGDDPPYRALDDLERRRGVECTANRVPDGVPDGVPDSVPDIDVASGSARAPRRGGRRDRRRAARGSARAHRGRRRCDRTRSPSRRRGPDRIGQEPGVPRTRGGVGIEGRRRDVDDRAAAPARRQGPARAGRARKHQVLLRVAQGSFELSLPRQAARVGVPGCLVRGAGRARLRPPTGPAAEIRRTVRHRRPGRARTRDQPGRVGGRQLHERRVPGQVRVRRRRRVLRGAGARPRARGVRARREPRALLLAPRVRGARAPGSRHRDHRRGAFLPRQRHQRVRGRYRDRRDQQGERHAGARGSRQGRGGGAQRRGPALGRGHRRARRHRRRRR